MNSFSQVYSNICEIEGGRDEGAEKRVVAWPKTLVSDVAWYGLITLEHIPHGSSWIK